MVIKVFLAIWLVVTTGYAGYDIWSDFKEGQMDKAYQSGASDTVQKIIAELENNQCAALPIRFEDKQLSVIDTRCLQSPQSGAEQAPGGTQANQKK